MELNFERGDPSQPRGHALIYFRDISNPTHIGATYLTVLPIIVDIAKYIPPFMAGQMESMDTSDMSAFTFPPAPEPFISIEALIDLSEKRGDDLLFGGDQRLDDVTNLMGIIASITSDYKNLYDTAVGSFPELSKKAEPILNGTDEIQDVNDLVYALMNQKDLLKELTKLMGQLRYAIEGDNNATALEAEMKLKAIGRQLPQNRQVDRLIYAAKDTSSESPKIASLYLERAYSLFKEDYRAVKAAEETIQSIIEKDAGDLDKIG